VTRTHPTSMLVELETSPRAHATSSVEPPPMSTSRMSSSTGRPAATPRAIIAASAAPSSNRVAKP